MSGLSIHYKPKSITGLFIAAGILFVGAGTMIGNAEMTEYGNIFLLLGGISWIYHVDKYSKKSVNKMKPVRRPRR